MIIALVLMGLFHAGILALIWIQQRETNEQLHSLNELVIELINQQSLVNQQSATQTKLDETRT